MNRPSRQIVIMLFLSLCCVANAQPSWVKKASKAVFTLNAFSDDGSLVGTATGFFTDQSGVGISSFAPLQGASRAVVIDAQGKEYQVESILGANDTYDLVKLNIAAKKVTALPILPSNLESGNRVWLLPFREQKNVPQATVTRSETIGGKYAYYTMRGKTTDIPAGTPVITEAGTVAAVMQQPMEGDTVSYAVSALMADSLQMTAFGMNTPLLRSTKIKKALPASLEQAVLALYLASSSTESGRLEAVTADFIEQFPTAPDGYQYRAVIETDRGDCQAAEKDMLKAIELSTKKDDAHFQFSKLIYQYCLQNTGEEQPLWTFQKALDEADKAIAIDPQPIYTHQHALVLYAMQDYNAAAEELLALTTTPLRTPDLFFEASQCKAMLADTLGQLALLDSCVAELPKPYLKDAAPYLLARSQVLVDLKRYRDAVSSLNDYEKLMAAQLTDHFYYVRFQTEQDGRLYQLALNDIAKAISMRPDYELYYAEQAALQVRVGLFDEAIETARQCIAVAPDYSDGYLFLGLALCEKGQTAEGLQHLEKASALGDQQANALIEKYKNKK